MDGCSGRVRPIVPAGRQHREMAPCFPASQDKPWAIGTIAQAWCSSPKAGGGSAKNADSMGSNSMGHYYGRS